MGNDNLLIMVAVELGFTYCQQGYTLEKAKADTLKELEKLHRNKPNINPNGDRP